MIIGKFAILEAVNVFAQLFSFILVTKTFEKKVLMNVQI